MIILDSEKCVGCNSCVRVCPTHDANSANIGENGNIIITINNDRCINCGECIKVCAHGARDYLDDTDKFFEDLKTNNNLILLVAPSIKVAFEDYWESILEWFRKKGVKYILDGGFGADICTWGYIELINQNNLKHIISQPCSATTSYILKYRPKLVKHLSPVHSPLLCLAIYARKYMNLNGKIAALTPCIAKSEEFKDTNIITYNITFKKLKDYFDKNKISFSINNNFKFDCDKGLMGSLYPIPGGLKKNLNTYTDARVINSEGISKVYKDLKSYEKEKEENLPDVFDILNCEYGCTTGPGIDEEFSIFKINKVMNNIEKSPKKTKKVFNKKDMFKKFSKELNLSDFLRQYKTDYVENKKPNQQQLEEIFNKLHKFDETSRHFDCRACGFDSCKAMAYSIFNGNNLVENCVKNTKASLEDESLQLTTMNNQITEITKQLSDVFNTLTNNINNVSSNMSDIDKYNKKNETDAQCLMDNIDKLKVSSNQIVNAMTEINEMVNNYNDMTESVKQIANQINMLSINASIEAARAGEVGKGFAVVAQNVGVLAENSKQAVAEATVCNDKVDVAIENINKIVENINSMITDLVEMAHSILKNIKLTSESGRTISSSIQDVNNVSKEVEELIIKTQR